jgi:hypothetical protein
MHLKHLPMLFWVMGATPAEDAHACVGYKHASHMAHTTSPQAVGGYVQRFILAARCGKVSAT